MHAIGFGILLIKIIFCLCQDNWPQISLEEPHGESVLEGSDVELRCAGRYENVSAVWEYKSCGDSYKMTQCSKAIADEYNGWALLSDAATTGRLLLRDVQTRDQGLYRCRQRATDHILVHNAVRLEVFPRDDDNKDDELPTFLDNLPMNVTVHKGSQAVFQCKVLSHTPPRILWVATGSPGAESFRYHQHWYSPMTAAATVGLPSSGHYLSKMVMPHAKTSDAGRYYCVAINTKGFTNSSAYLQVIDDEQQWSLYLLFLIPLGLAALPVLLWGCYLLMRRRRGKLEEPSDQPLRTSIEYVL